MSTLREQAALHTALATKLEEAAALEEQLGSSSPTPAPAASTGKRRGRKPGSKNAAKSTTSSKPKGESTGRGRRNGPKSMKEMVVTVLKGKKKGLQLSDIVQAVIDGGYETKAKNPVNVVYQAVYKLMKDEDTPDEQKIEKTDEHKYRLKAAA
tara:strand:- start:8919 stop:9377 length:459 start_codon:yes stop_codon:yes gene_type:complete